LETDWNTPDNWDDGKVPTATTNVIIPEGSANYPEVSGVFSCQDMEIKDGANVIVQSGAVMSIKGNLNVGQGSTGILVISGGTCNVKGIITALPGSVINVINGGVMNDNE